MEKKLLVKIANTQESKSSFLRAMAALQEQCKSNGFPDFVNVQLIKIAESGHTFRNLIFDKVIEMAEKRENRQIKLVERVLKGESTHEDKFSYLLIDYLMKNQHDHVR